MSNIPTCHKESDDNFCTIPYVPYNLWQTHTSLEEHSLKIGIYKINQFIKIDIVDTEWTTIMGPVKYLHNKTFEKKFHTKVVGFYKIYTQLILSAEIWKSSQSHL